MSVKVNIAGGCGHGFKADVTEEMTEKHGLVVATRPLKTFTTRIAFATHGTYGREMNQNASYGGSPVLIHNGIDDVAWTMTQPVGGADWTANSTNRFYAGAASAYCNRAETLDRMQVINNLGPGNDIDLNGNYTAITMWLNVDNNWAANDSFSLCGVLDGAQVGNKVYLEDYFDYTVTDIWHYLTIPLTDLGIDALSIDAFWVECEAIQGTKPRFYIDNWYLQATGAPIAFSVKPSEGTWFHIDMVRITMADAYTGIVTVAGATENATMPGVSYDKFLGMTPSAGMKLEGYRNRELVPGTGSQVTDIGDMLALPSTKITNAISDGTNTCITLERSFPHPIVIKAEEDDELRITIEDDFSALLKMQFSCIGCVETR